MTDSTEPASLFDSGIQEDATPEIPIVSPMPSIPLSTKPSLGVGVGIDTRPLNIAERFRAMTTTQIREAIAPQQLPFAIMAVNITICLNIGNMIRSAILCGASKFIVFGRRKIDARACVGAQNYITIEKLGAIPDASLIQFEELTAAETDDILDSQAFIDFIIANNYLPVFIEQDKFSRPATTGAIKDILQRARTLGRTPLFIFGSEGFGIPRNLLDTRLRGGIDLSYTLELKQRGCIRSFNVANCCSIICYKVMEAFDELDS